MLLLSLIMLLNLQSCGKNDILPTHDIKKTFGFNYDDKMNNLDDEIEALKKRVSNLESQVAININNISSIQSDILSINADIESLELLIEDLSQDVDANSTSIALLQSQVTNHNSRLTSLEALVNSIQTTTNGLVADVAQLESHENIVEFIDPCGDWAGGYDEVILKTSSGKFLAYFENGSRRFLSLLEKNVNYMVTDGSGCRFYINNSNQVIF
jgi:peptidoglycan hydrolase CwlO-like protein